MNTVVDPVCEKQVLPWWAMVRGLHAEVGDKRYYFCSSECHQVFTAHPAAYTMTEDQLRASDDGMSQPTDTTPDQP